MHFHNVHNKKIAHSCQAASQFRRSINLQLQMDQSIKVHINALIGEASENIK